MSVRVLLAVELAEAGVVEAAVAISGVSAAITLATLEFVTTIFAPYMAVMTYPIFPAETIPLTVTVLVAPGAVLVGTAKKESSVCNSCV
jgi:hypothetical protein